MKRSLLKKHWILPEESSADLPASFLIAKLAAQRQIDLTGDVQPRDAKDLYTGMELAVERIQKAATTNEHIGVFGDYDCDGVTSVAQLVRMLRRRNINPIVRLPHRVHDGYGLKKKHIDEFLQRRVTLLITADTGICDVDAVAYAEDQGMNVVILDHHHPPQELPPAFAIVHPALSSAFPGAHPSAAGVVFDVVSVIEQGMWNDRETDVSLAMIGTIADVVPLTQRNRSLVIEGLRALEFVGGPLGVLRDRTVGEKKPTSTDIAFRVAPRLNAAGRMDRPDIALDALLHGGASLEMLELLNGNRQDETQSALEEALKTVSDDTSFIVLASPSYQPGIVGLIAGRLTEATGKPTLVAAIRDGICTASLRSPKGYSIIDALTRCSRFLTAFGGHAQAAGCSFPLDVLPALQEALEADVEATADVAALVPTLTIDAILDPQDITLELCEGLQRLEPFGSGNPEPKFLIPGASLSNLRRVGGDGAHMQGALTQAKIIGFRFGEHIDAFTQPIDLVCSLGIDRWNGRSQPQLTVHDARACVPRAAYTQRQLSSQ